MSSAPELAVTLGDPRGIGLEVTREAARRIRDEENPPSLAFVVPEGLAGTKDLAARGRILHIPAWDGTERDAGRVSIEALRVAVSEALAGRVRGVVTGPVHKPALHRAGWDAPGQTEILQDLAHVPEVGMLMCAERSRLGGPLRVLLATTHLPLRDVAFRVSEDLLVSQTRLLDRALRRHWGVEEPRIALCALNPHASDRGLFGDEEEQIYRPALARIRAEGIAAVGPLPADTVFVRALQGEFDAVVAPYHDVGMAAFKTASFGTGVNVTLGLPFIRTSPDHGTAFDIAGSGQADASSMTEAVHLAGRLARTGFDTVEGDI
ncbi:MAG: 4-hydroxythreonine-4-phosphate dehydrogenase PdxA [Gemmatimonadota bacterium]